MNSNSLQPLLEIVNQAPWLAMIGVAMIGGCIGSFMNVVVFRLPAGQSLIRPGSQCPACGHAIRWYDNLPVVGWLRLRGKCRDCGRPISARYPAVELLVICVFLGFWMHDVQAAVAPQRAAGVFTFVWHTGMMCILICAALVELDGHPLPKSIVVFGILFAAILSQLWLDAASQALGMTEMKSVTQTMIVGALGATVATTLMNPPVRLKWLGTTESSVAQLISPLAVSAVTGLYLGSSQAFVTAMLAGLIWRLSQILHLREGRGVPWSWFLAAMSWMTATFPL